MRRPKVYIAAAFRQFSDWSGPESSKAYGAIANEGYVRLLESIEDRFLEYGFETCLPHRDEGQWGRVYYEPQAIGALCFRHVETSDVVFALAEGGRGVHLELGFAAGLGQKPMILMFREGTEPSTLTWGLPGLRTIWPDIGEPETTTVLEYGDDADLDSRLDSVLQTWFPELRAQGSRGPHYRTLAIIDIGSHTLKFQAQRRYPTRRAEVLAEDRLSIGLIGDINARGAFSRETIDAVISQLAHWRHTAADLGCTTVTVVGTEALRRASNSEILAERLFHEFGWSLEILDPDRELDYVYTAVTSHLYSDSPAAVLNVGGGSTQVGIGAGHGQSRLKLPFGTRDLVGQWPWDEPMSDSAYAALMQHVRSAVSSTPPTGHEITHMFHTGGELDFLLRCRVPMRTSTIAAGHVSELAVDEFARFADRFRKYSRPEACRAFGLDEKWASGAVASNAIAIAVAETVGAAMLVPSNLNVSDGVAAAASPALPVR